MKNIDESINQLEELVNSAKTMPFANKSLIDAEKVKDIIEDMRKNLPEEIKRARYIDNEKDKIIAEAQAKANQLVDTAEERSKSLMQTTNARVKTLISENNITQQALKEAKNILNKAQAKADEIILNATNKADGLKKATNEYILKNLSTSEQILMDSLDSIRKTRGAISNASKKTD